MKISVISKVSRLFLVCCIPLLLSCTLRDKKPGVVITTPHTSAFDDDQTLPTPIAKEESPSSGATLPTKKTSGAIDFKLMHTVQECQHDGHQRTWCDGKVDTSRMAELSGLEKEIIDQLERTSANPAKARIFAAEFSFSDKPIQQKMCELGKKGVKIEIYLDRGSAGDIEFTKDPNCQLDPTKPNLVGRLLGGFTDFPDWRLHHNKTVYIDVGDGSEVNVNFSSGNLSRFGMSLHMDNWVMMKALPSSNISRATLCLFGGLRAADKKATELGMYSNGNDFDKDPAVMDTYQKTINSCYAKNKVVPMGDYEKALAQEGIAPFFTPNQGYYAVKALKAQIYRVIKKQSASTPQYIWIAIEHFSKGDIATALQEAGAAGVDVRIVMNSGTVTGATEVASDGQFYKEKLRNKKGIRVMFIETNPDAGGNGQQMHNKFAIFSGERVFSGAGHYTSSGLSTNFETLYLTQNANLTSQYKQYFEKLWAVAVDESYFPANLSEEH